MFCPVPKTTPCGTADLYFQLDLVDGPLAAARTELLELQLRHAARDVDGNAVIQVTPSSVHIEMNKLPLESTWPSAVTLNYIPAHFGRPVRRHVSSTSTSTHRKPSRGRLARRWLSARRGRPPAGRRLPARPHSMPLSRRHPAPPSPVPGGATRHLDDDARPTVRRLRTANRKPSSIATGFAELDELRCCRRTHLGSRQQVEVAVTSVVRSELR